jgi:hypothetical protein
VYDFLLLVILLNNFVIFEERNGHNYNQNSQHLYQDPGSNLTNTSIGIPLFIWVRNLGYHPEEIYYSGVRVFPSSFPCNHTVSHPQEESRKN